MAMGWDGGREKFERHEGINHTKAQMKRLCKERACRTDKRFSTLTVQMNEKQKCGNKRSIKLQWACFKNFFFSSSYLRAAGLVSHTENHFICIIFIFYTTVLLFQYLKLDTGTLYTGT